MSRANFCRLVVGACLTIACSTSDHRAAATSQAAEDGGLADAGPAQFEDIACPMPIPTQLDPANVRCGMLTVPELHAKPGGPTIQLAVAIVKATGPSPAADRVPFLTGGPGQAALDGTIANYVTSEALPELLKNRDWIFFDQRGIGYSKPALDCAEREDAYWKALAQPMTSTAFNDQIAASMKACHDRLVASGVNLGAYRTSETAQDAHDIMKALGYHEWNLFGASYGTLVAQAAMREAPEGLRSVVLDSSGPLDYERWSLGAP